MLSDKISLSKHSMRVKDKLTSKMQASAAAREEVFSGVAGGA
jgi:hypothetical protein